MVVCGRNVRGWIVVLGGVLVHLTLGTMYSFGNLNPYITSYIRKYSTPKDLHYGQSVWIFAMATMGVGISSTLGGIVNRYLGPRITTLIGSLISSAGVMLTYFTIKQSFVAVTLTYGLMFGLGIGIAYASPMNCAMLWMPKRKGVVSGCVVAGFGGGAFIFIQLQTAYVNHGNLPPDETVNGEKFFTQEQILEKVPKLFLILGACYVAMQLIGVSLISNPPKEVTESVVNDSDKLSIIDRIEPLDERSSAGDDIKIINEDHSESENKDLSPMEVLKDKYFYLLWFILLFNLQGVVLFSSLYKAYGETFIEDDSFLALVGAFSALFNAGGRIAWGHFADRLSFKTAMITLCGLFTILMLTFCGTAYGGKVWFFIHVCLVYGTFSGNFSLFPFVIAKCFGQKHYPINFGMLFTASVITSPIGAVLASQLKILIGWYGLFFLVSGFSFASLMLMFFFKVKSKEGKDI